MREENRGETRTFRQAQAAPAASSRTHPCPMAAATAPPASSADAASVTAAAAEATSDVPEKGSRRKRGRSGWIRRRRAEPHTHLDHRPRRRAPHRRAGRTVVLGVRHDHGAPPCSREAGSRDPAGRGCRCRRDRGRRDRPDAHRGLRGRACRRRARAHARRARRPRRGDVADRSGHAGACATRTSLRPTRSPSPPMRGWRCSSTESPSSKANSQAAAAMEHALTGWDLIIEAEKLSDDAVKEYNKLTDAVGQAVQEARDGGQRRRPRRPRPSSSPRPQRSRTLTSRATSPTRRPKSPHSESRSRPTTRT